MDLLRVYYTSLDTFGGVVWYLTVTYLTVTEVRAALWGMEVEEYHRA